MVSQDNLVYKDLQQKDVCLLYIFKQIYIEVVLDGRAPGFPGSRKVSNN